MVVTPNYSALLILASLADGEAHGYGVRRDVESRTGGAVRLRATTVYRLLAVLSDDGLIEAGRARAASRLDDSRRRYFRIPNRGRRILAGEMRKLARVRRAVRPAGKRQG